MADPGRKSGYGLSLVDVKCIEDFYQDDELSRQCPGKKDFKIVLTVEGKKHFQKRMLLTNLKELYLELKKT